MQWFVVDGRYYNANAFTEIVFKPLFPEGKGDNIENALLFTSPPGALGKEFITVNQAQAKKLFEYLSSTRRVEQVIDLG